MVVFKEGVFWRFRATVASPGSYPGSDLNQEPRRILQ